mgnify:CR=1 FL=1
MPSNIDIALNFIEKGGALDSAVAKLREIRPYVIVGAFVISAIVTPPDVLSQLLLAVPMTLLYELGLLVARLYVPKPNPEEQNPES